MAADASGTGALITDKSGLTAYLAAGCKPRDSWRIGTEHEKFAFRLDDHSPLAYDSRPGIRDVLNALTRFGWQPVRENGNIIALSGANNATVSLEPGGQVELSGAPVETIHQTCAEVNQHLQQVREICKELDIAMMGMGFNPKWRRQDMHWMPKERYRIMQNYMPTRGDHGLDMMLRTCTVQVNLDYSDEDDMVRKFRIGLALQPVVTAMFANSPFVEGKVAGYLSYRSQMWTNTDSDRCGMMPFVFEDGFGFERYVEWMLDVPMYFVNRDGKYIDAAGQSFRDFMDGRLPALPGERPTLSDWEDHLTTAFPEVRLKTFLEMRGADGGPWRRLCALPAFWIGLLYDQAALDAAWEMVKDWSVAEMAMLRAEVPRHGLATAFRNRTVLDLARDALGMSREGLRSRACTDSWGQDETMYLATLEQIVDSGLSPADNKLAAFHGRWNGDIDRAFEEYVY